MNKEIKRLLEERDVLCKEVASELVNLRNRKIMVSDENDKIR